MKRVVPRATKKTAPRAVPWFGERGASSRLGAAITKRNAWGDVTDVSFQEYVAREHLDGNMPVVELHRNHGIPLSAVRRWIATYTAEGSAGLERAAATLREREQVRDAKLAKRRAKPEEVAQLTAMIASHDITKMRAAYAVIKKQKMTALVPAILDAIRWADTLRDRSIQDELELLSAIKAKEALHELLGSKLKVVRRSEDWFSGLLQKAGCAIRTIEKPWSQQYELGGTWYPVKVRR